MKTATDLEDLLHEVVMEIPGNMTADLFALNQAAALREKSGVNTVSDIYTGDEKLVGMEVKVFSRPPSRELLVKKSLKLDSKLKPNELKFVYFDAYEVKRFNEFSGS